MDLEDWQCTGDGAGLQNKSVAAGRHRKVQLNVFLLDLVRLKVLGEVNGVVDGSLRGRINGHMCGWLAW